MVLGNFIRHLACIALTATFLTGGALAKGNQSVERIKELQQLQRFCKTKPRPDDRKCRPKNFKASMAELDELLKKVAKRGGNQVANQPEGMGVYLLNCSNKPITVKSFDLTDSLLAIPYSNKRILHGQVASLNCKTFKCKLRVGNSPASVPMAGYVHYFTNSRTTGTLAYWIRTELKPGYGNDALCG